MHDDFKSWYPDIKACYETYRRVVSSMNISFVKLGEEECEDCIRYEAHEHEDEQGCDICNQWTDHKEGARRSRMAYQDDRNREPDPKEVYFSVDMQKVIMLPRIPGVKTCVFTKRIVAFHETFATLGGKSKRKDNAPVGIIWHEAISGRNAEDVMSAYSKVIRGTEYRDCERFVFWADNCTAQNKNWTLFTGMVAEVNLEGGPQSITMKYLEKGHTFMSADSFHAEVEKAMRSRKNLFDFDDFRSVIDMKGTAVAMKPTDFSLWENGMSSAKFTHKPIISSVTESMFRKGSTKIFWKTAVDADYQSGEFLKKKVAASLLKGNPFERQTHSRGIPSVKKADIISKLCPLMPANRREFWQELPTNDNVADLLTNIN